MALVLPNRAAVLDRRRRALGAVRVTAGATSRRIWDSLPDHSADSQDAFAVAAGPVIRGAQDRAVSLSLAAFAALTGVDPKLDRAALLQTMAVDLARPFFAFGKALNDGDVPDEALAAGADKAQTLGEDAVSWAARSAGTAFDHSDVVTGWRRVPDAEACDWCVLVAGQGYRTADSAAFGHDRCGCDIEPLLAGEEA